MVLRVVRYGAALVVLLAWTALGPTRGRAGWPTSSEPGKLLIRQFSPLEYGASALIQGVTQDRRGVIFAAAADGILEYDGSYWRLIEHPSGAEILSVAADDQGSIFVGCAGDLGRLAADAKGELRFVSLKDHFDDLRPPVGRVENIVVTTSGVYFQTARRLLRLRAAPDTGGWQTKVWNQPPEEKFHCISYSTQSGLGRILLGGANAGLAELVHDSIRPLEGATGVKGYVVGIVEMDDGGLLVTTHSDGLYRYRNGTVRRFKGEADEFAKQHLAWKTLRLAHDRFVLLSHRGGAGVFDANGRMVRVLNRDHGLVGVEVRDGLLDAEGGLWLATQYGLARVSHRSSIQYFDADLGLHEVPLAMRRFQGTIYVGTTSGVYLLQPSSNPGFPARFIRSLSFTGDCRTMLTATTLTGDARLLVGSNEGLFEYDGSNPPIHHPLKGYIADMTLSADGRVLYAATLYRGLQWMKREGNRWKVQPRIKGPSDHLAKVVQDPTGRLWMTARDEHTYRLERIDNPLAHPRERSRAPQVRIYDQRAGLPMTRGATPFIWRGQLQVATESGVFRFLPASDRFERETSLTTFSRQGVQRQPITSISVDPQQRLWLAARFSSLVCFSAGKDPKTGGAKDHQQIQQTIRFRPAPEKLVHRLYIEPSGVVWAATVDGWLIRYEHTLDHPSPRPAAPLLRKVQVISGDNQMIFGGAKPRPKMGGAQNRVGPTSAAASLNYQKGVLRFEFSQSRYEAPQAIRYQSRLVGMDEHWSNWSGEAFREFTALREGDYRFEVRMRDEERRVSPAAAFVFQVHPPWYRAWWAKALFGLCGVGAVFGLAAWRVWMSQRTVQRLEATVNARTADLRQSERRLRQAHDELERKVEQRTGELKRSHQNLSDRLQFEEVISRISADFIDAPAERFDQLLQRALETVIGFAKVDRGGVFQFSEDSQSAFLAHEHHGRGVPPGVEASDFGQWPKNDWDLSDMNLRWFWDRSRDGLPWNLARLSDLPPHADAERRFFQSRGTKSLLHTPIQAGEEVLGFIYLETVQQQRQWSLEFVEQMRLFARIFAGALLRRRAEHALTESEELFRTLCENAPVGIFLLAPWADGGYHAGGNCLYVNPTCSEIIDLPPERAVGRGWTKRLHPHDRSWLLESWAGAVERGQNFSAEYRFVSPTGKTTWVQSRSVPRRSKEGEIIGYLGIMLDTSEQKATMERLNQQETMLAHVSRVSAMGELVASIAHEVNQPLYSIQNFSKASGNLLQNDLPTQPDSKLGRDLELLREWNEQMVQAAGRAGEIIKRLRHFVSREEPQREPQCINEIVSESIDLLAFEARRSGAQIQLELAEDLRPVEVDRVQIQQVLVNLVKNSLDAMTDSNCRPRVVVIRTIATGEGVEIAVTDTGPGLSGASCGMGRQDIFAPFVTSKPDGMGMGLAISRTIVESHGGRLWAHIGDQGRPTQGSVGHGAEFRFSLGSSA